MNSWIPIINVPSVHVKTLYVLFQYVFYLGPGIGDQLADGAQWDIIGGRRVRASRRLGHSISWRDKEG